MLSDEPSPTNRRYLIALGVPQDVRLVMNRTRSVWAHSGFIPTILPPMLPIQESRAEPKPPVPGGLPPCPEPMRLGLQPEKDPVGEWWYWPVSCGDWLVRLGEAVGGLSNPPDSPSGFWPMGRGIPLAADPDAGTEGERNAPALRYPGERGWRALVLEAWAIEYDAPAIWYRNLRWRRLWSRRLKRAPPLTNNDKHT